ncbi:redoxin domain-containing protein [Parabacteroides sp. OttesenSCG-928-G07]|nr:redoxin domain-containing protein [Parabacteroides sp. OttesenSCG-928-G07]
MMMAVVCLMSGQVKAQTIPTASADVSPMLVGETMPDATLVSAAGREVSLYALMNKPTVIVFYRGTWCPNCITNFKEEFLPNLAEFDRQGYNLITIAPDAPASLTATAAATSMDAKYFYGDPTGALSKALGLAWKQQDRMAERLTEASGGKNTDMTLPVPAVYIVGADNEIIFADIRPNAIPAAKRAKWNIVGAALQAYR